MDLANKKRLVYMYSGVNHEEYRFLNELAVDYASGASIIKYWYKEDMITIVSKRDGLSRFRGLVLNDMDQDNINIKKFKIYKEI